MNYQSLLFQGLTIPIVYFYASLFLETNEAQLLIKSAFFVKILSKQTRYGRKKVVVQYFQ